MHEAGRRSGLLQIAGHPPFAFLRNYLLRGGFRDGVPGLDHLDAERVLRVPEVLETVADPARYRCHAAPYRIHRAPYRSTEHPTDPPSTLCVAPSTLRCSPFTSTPPARGVVGRTRCCLTVNGLREIGHRAALVAHPDGELRRRASEGLELIPIAPRTEVDLSAAWRLARVVKKLRPDVVHAHDPHGIAMAALALSFAGGAPAPVLIASRRVDFHLKGNSLSRWKYRQVDCFIAASEVIRQMLVADGIPAGRTVTVHEGIDVEHVAAAERREPPRVVLAAPPGPGRRQRGGAGAAQGPAVPDRRRAPGRAGSPGCAVRDSWRRRTARSPRAAGP